MADRRRQMRSRAWGGVLLLAVVGLLLFVASTLTHQRWDWTEGQVYSLSDSTLKLIGKLDEPVMIRAYVTPDLPQPYGRLQRFIEDMLVSYHDASNGRIGYEVIDPASDRNIAASLKAMNIPRVQVQSVEDDRAQVRQGYLAVVIEYLDKKEVIPVVQGEQGFEYLLTRKIRKLTGMGRGKIGVVSGFGADGLYAFRKLQHLVTDDYDLVEIEPDKRPIPDDIKAIIIAGVSEAPSMLFRYRIDQFRMSGRGVMVLAGNTKPLLSMGFKVRPINGKANAWLKKDLGVAIEPGLVMDHQATRVAVNQQQGSLMFRSLVDYPFVMNVTHLSATHPVTKGLEAVTVPFASPLLWAGDADAHHTILMRSSAQAATEAGPPFDVAPLVSMQQRFAGLQQRQVAVALAADGPAQSAFDQAPAGADSKGFRKATQQSHLIVMGAPAFLGDEFVEGQNLVAVLNMMDWLTGDTGLIELRSRGVTERPLADLASAGRTAFKLLWMLGLPLLIVMLGGWRWWRLRRLGRSVSA